MNLGEKIYSLRNEKNMSQGDLADMLGVSRQSVSKWENNSAVPELDKIVELSKIFDISLDELVKGESIKNSNINNVEENNEAAAVKQIVYVTPKQEGRKIAGTILLCMAFLVFLLFTLLGGIAEGLIFQSPFLICGIICFAVKKNTGLICAWVMAFLLDTYFRWGTGLNFRTTLWTFYWTHELNFVRLAIAWVQLLAILAIITVTIVRIGKGSMIHNIKNRNLLTVGYAVITAAIILIQILISTQTVANLINVLNLNSFTAVLIFSFIDWIQFFATAFLVGYTIRYFKAKKLEK